MVVNMKASEQVKFKIGTARNRAVRYILKRALLFPPRHLICPPSSSPAHVRPNLDTGFYPPVAYGPGIQGVSQQSHYPTYSQSVGRSDLEMTGSEGFRIMCIIWWRCYWMWNPLESACRLTDHNCFHGILFCIDLNNSWTSNWPPDCNRWARFKCSTLNYSSVRGAFGESPRCLTDHNCFHGILFCIDLSNSWTSNWPSDFNPWARFKCSTLNFSSVRGEER